MTARLLTAAGLILAVILAGHYAGQLIRTHVPATGAVHYLPEGDAR